MSPRVAAKYALLAVFLLLLAVWLFFFLRHITGDRDMEKPTAPGQTDAALSINQFRHTATREGRTEWILKAASAEYFTESQVRLNDLTLTFFPADDQPETRLEAKKGRLDLKTQDMDISGRIIAENRRYRLETETLHYSHDSHIISTQTPVHIEGEAVALEADTMSYNLKTGEMICQGNVKGTLSGEENIKFFE